MKLQEPFFLHSIVFYYFFLLLCNEKKWKKPTFYKSQNLSKDSHNYVFEMQKGLAHSVHVDYVLNIIELGLRGIWERLIICQFNLNNRVTCV